MSTYRTNRTEADFWYSEEDDQEGIDRRWQANAREFTARIRAGEDPRAVGNEIIARIKREKAERESGQAGERGE